MKSYVFMLLVAMATVHTVESFSSCPSSGYDYKDDYCPSALVIRAKTDLNIDQQGSLPRTDTLTVLETYKGDNPGSTVDILFVGGGSCTYPYPATNGDPFVIFAWLSMEGVYEIFDCAQVKTVSCMDLAAFENDHLNYDCSGGDGDDGGFVFK